MGNTEDLDFAVVGSGSGGLAAAIVAHDAGLKVALFEKAPVVGGGTAYSGGVIWAPCNHVMERKGIEDSVDDAIEYLAHASGGRGDARLARAYVENVAKVVVQVEEWSGVKWVIWPNQPDYYPDLPGASMNGRAILPHPNSADKVLTPAEEEMPEMRLVRETPHMDFVPGFQHADRPAREAWVAGRSIIGGLWKAFLDRGIPFHLSTPGRSLLIEGGEVVGIEVEAPSGHRREVRTRLGVLLNTGGFDWDEELSRHYLPGPRVTAQTPPTNSGDGHRMAMAAGAATALLDKALWHPSILIPGDTHETGEPLYRMFNAELSKPHCIAVNATGSRFSSEAAYYALADAWFQTDWKTRKFLNVPSYFIADHQYTEKYGMPGVRVGDSVPSWITEADSIPELAAKIGVDADGLAREVETYNRDCQTGVDSRFNRGSMAYERYWGDPDHDGPNPTMGAIVEPPFHAFPLHLSHAGTRGGVMIGTSAEVQHADGGTIPGLYASGNTAANLLFGAGYGSGSAVGSSMVFGYLAGQHVVSGGSRLA